MVTQQIIHGFLLALHNIALVGCAAAPFYNRSLVLQRGQYGPKLFYELDKVVEDTLQGNAPYCIAFMITLVATGIGMPLNNYLFSGETHQLLLVSQFALVAKLICVGAMATIMAIIFIKINPRLRELFASFQTGANPQPDSETEFFALRSRRKKLCEICLGFALGVLIFSAFMGFQM